MCVWEGERWEVSGGGRVIVKKRGSYKKTSGWISLDAFFFFLSRRYCHIEFSRDGVFYHSSSSSSDSGQIVFCFVFFQGGRWFCVMIARQHTHTHETQLYFLKERLEEEDGGVRVGRLRWEDEVGKAEDGGSRCGRLRGQKGSRLALNVLLCPWSRCTSR